MALYLSPLSRNTYFFKKIFKTCFSHFITTSTRNFIVIAFLASTTRAALDAFIAQRSKQQVYKPVRRNLVSLQGEFKYSKLTIPPPGTTNSSLNWKEITKVSLILQRNSALSSR